MATFAIPLNDFDSVDLKSASFAETLQGARRTVAALSEEIRKSLEVDRRILARCSDPAVDSASADELKELASRIERLLRTRAEQLSELSDLSFELPEVAQMKEQLERLDSLAETFRMGADPASRQAGRALAKAADSETSSTPKSSWRELVGSLHD
jgi:hypothetical protein